MGGRLGMRSALVLGLALLIASACRQSEAVRSTGPATASGAPERPQRIVSLIPATTEMLFAMDAGERVIAVSNYDHFPPEVEKLPRVGGLLDPSVEKILALQPDLVIVYDTQSDLKQELERAGIPIFSYKHQDLTDITSTLRALGDRTGSGPAAEEAASGIERALAGIRAQVNGRPRPRTLLVFGREPGALRNVLASGGYGFLHDVLEIAGGADVLSDVKRQSVQMSAEMILTRAPDVIVELHYGASLPIERLDAERQGWSALPAVPAVRNQQVHLLVGDEFVVPGPRIVRAAERLARTLHSDRFR